MRTFNGPAEIQAALRAVVGNNSTAQMSTLGAFCFILTDSVWKLYLSHLPNSAPTIEVVTLTVTSRIMEFHPQLGYKLFAEFARQHGLEWLDVFFDQQWEKSEAHTLYHRIMKVVNRRQDGPYTPPPESDLTLIQFAD